MPRAPQADSPTESFLVGLLGGLAGVGMAIAGTVDEVRRAEFFPKGRKMRDVIKGKRWLLLSRWKNRQLKQKSPIRR
jgi:hypothetical protein